MILTNLNDIKGPTGPPVLGDGGHISPEGILDGLLKSHMKIWEEGTGHQEDVCQEDGRMDAKGGGTPRREGGKMKLEERLAEKGGGTARCEGGKMK